MTTMDLLRRRYAEKDGWRVFVEVTVSGRRGDVMALNLWRTRGRAIHGFEIKSSRQDALRELGDREKAETLMRPCDFWWLLAETPGLVQVEELPAGWGLLERRGDTLRTARHAVRREKQAIHRTDEFWCRLVAQAFDEGRKAASAAHPPTLYAELREQARAEAAKGIEHDRIALMRDRAAIDEFLGRLLDAGIDYRALRWEQPRAIARAVSLLARGTTGLVLQARGVKEAADALVAALEDATVPEKETV